MISTHVPVGTPTPNTDNLRRTGLAECFLLKIGDAGGKVLILSGHT
jgi:hypothetical protein